MSDKEFDEAFQNLIKHGYLIEVEPGQYTLGLKKGCFTCIHSKGVEDSVGDYICKVTKEAVDAGGYCDSFEPNDKYKFVESMRQ